MYDRTFNRHCQALGQPPLHGNSLLAWTRAERTVVLVSRHYFGPEPDDWPGWQLGGFSHWAGPQGRRMDPDVEEYLGEGDPPVLVCLGTSAAAGAATAFATIADGLGRASLRPLMFVGSARNLELLDGVPGTFEFAPVGAVADRCAAAVVSGALGTLAAALTAGLPVVVLPQLFDQVWHGHRVEELGVGIMVTRPEKVAGAVARLLGDPRYGARARELAGSMRPEDGAGSLVAAVEATI
jgi:UDP:flavonoid glycosyltransferase YjiC (YdhE family)